MLQDLKKVGKKGDIVKVAEGYGRNFLIAKKYAVEATKQNINVVIGGKCKDEIRSNMIINYGYLHLLRGAGNMRVFDYEEYGTEIQTFYIDRETVLKICEKYGKKK